MIKRTFDNVKIIAKKTLYKKFFKANEYMLSIPLYNGQMSQTFTREISERQQAVGVLLFDAKLDKIVLVEQFRLGAYLAGDYPWILECVAGMVEDDEPIEQTAIREVKEESGVDVLNLERILHYHSSPGGLNEKIHLYCANVDSTKLPEYGGLETENEDIRVVAFPVSEIEGLLATNRANNGLLIITLQWFLLNKDKLKEKWANEKK